MGEKVLFVTEEHRCFSFRNVDGRMKRNDEESLNSYEEEADTRMLFHSMRSPKNVVFRTSDTDELIILLANMHRFDRNTHIWIEAGISSKNTLRYVDVNSIYHSLGDLLSRALTGFHVLTGNDNSAAFKRKGKLRPFALLKKSTTFEEALAKLGFVQFLDEGVIADIESSFVQFMAIQLFI